MSSAIPQLLLVKYLFQRGQDALAERGPYSAGLAVSLFQDAIELMARIIAGQVEANVGRDTKFDSLWDEIEKAPKNAESKVLPSKTKLSAINNARIGFKHYGNLPDPVHAAQFGADTEQFLDIACREFLRLEFKDVSLIDLIQHKEASAHLHNAERAIVSNDSESALSECRVALYYLEKPMSALLPRLDNNLSGAIRYMGDEGGNLEPVVRALEKHINGLRDFTVATSLGVALLDYIRFQHVTPSVSRTLDGKFHLQWYGGNKANSDNASFALKFVTDYGIAAEKVLAGLTETERGMLFN